MDEFTRIIFKCIASFSIGIQGKLPYKVETFTNSQGKFSLLNLLDE